jgi:hypothetical protein
MNGSPVKNGTGSQTTATVNYVAGPISASQSTLSPVTANIPDDGVTTQLLTVQAIDANGNNITTGGATVTLSTISGSGTLSGITDNGNGTYTATVESDTACTGIFVAFVGGSPVMGGSGSQSTSTITFDLGAVNAAASTLLPLSSTIIAGGSTQVLTVQVNDATGNNLPTTGLAVIISKVAGTKGSIDNNGGTSYDNGDGTYSAIITSFGTAGTFGVFKATIGGLTVNNSTGSQTLDTVFYGSDPVQSTLTPLAASITGNGTSTIVLTVQAKDKDGNNVTFGGETVTITKVTGTTGTIGSVIDNSDGTYSDTVTSAASQGIGKFVATLNGTKIGAPDTAKITYSGIADATHSTLTPTFASITADGISVQILTVQARDASDNNLSTGGASVIISQKSGTGIIDNNSGSSYDNGDGTYTAIVYAPNTTGSGIFVATLGGNPVKSGGGGQTQAIVQYIPGPADSSQTTLSPLLDSIASCGSTQILTVQAKDANGNNLVSGGDIVTITGQSGLGSIGMVTDNHNGTYTATVTSPSPTTNLNGVLVATINGSQVLGGTGSRITATITYTPGFTVGISGGTSPICTGTSPGTLTASGSGGPGPISYLWYANGISTGVTTNTYDPGSIALTSAYYCAVSSGSCGTISTPATIIVVEPAPVTGPMYRKSNQ